MSTVRLDSYVQNEIERQFGVKLSRTYVERLLEQGAVKLHDEVIKKKGFKVKPEKHKIEFDKKLIENTLSVYQTGKQQDVEADKWDASEMGISIDEERVDKAGDITQYILYEDDDIVAVNKPPGVSAHPGRGDKGADSMVYQFIKYMRNAHKYVPRAGLLHRLDKDTSGVLLFAKNMEAYNEVKKQFETRSIDKYYIAECDRTPRLNNLIKRYIANNHIQLRPTGFNGYTRDYLYNIIETKKPIDVSGFIAKKRGGASMLFTLDRRVARSFRNVKDCISDIFILDSDSNSITILFVPHTGRTHQIRVQSKFLGCPVKNDPIYGHSATRKGILGLTAKGIHFTVKGKDMSIFV